MHHTLTPDASETYNHTCWSARHCTFSICQESCNFWLALWSKTAAKTDVTDVEALLHLSPQNSAAVNSLSKCGPEWRQQHSKHSLSCRDKASKSPQISILQVVLNAHAANVALMNSLASALPTCQSSLVEPERAEWPHEISVDLDNAKGGWFFCQTHYHSTTHTKLLS